ncbi:MAG: transglutaminase family protein [Thermodesulfobacteriota bacterium]|nr:transglutaminase family protein [Thermodesulfobacteriota bacterium]
MRFRIVHETRYEYSDAVHLEPHFVRIRPRCDAFQNLVRHTLHVEPKPEGISNGVDAEGNSYAVAWFSGPVRRLCLRAESEVDTMRVNPFHFLVTDPKALRLPVRYAEPLARSLAPSIAGGPGDGGEALSRFVQDAEDGANGETLQFLSRLCSEIQQKFAKVSRPTGAPHPAAVTLEQKEGACRDLVVLYLESVRLRGLAARFVSGYHGEERSDGGHELHAWAEVYLPGAGWLGYDPSLGLAVADRHIALAASSIASRTVPVTGTFRSSTASAAMHTRLAIDRPNG